MKMPSCSIGVARYPADGEDADTLLSYADGDMYRVKNSTAQQAEAKPPRPARSQDRRTCLTIRRLDPGGYPRVTLRKHALGQRHRKMNKAMCRLRQEIRLHLRRRPQRSAMSRCHP